MVSVEIDARFRHFCDTCFRRLNDVCSISILKSIVSISRWLESGNSIEQCQIRCLSKIVERAEKRISKNGKRNNFSDLYCSAHHLSCRRQKMKKRNTNLHLWKIKKRTACTRYNSTFNYQNHYRAINFELSCEASSPISQFVPYYTEHVQYISTPLMTDILLFNN